MSLNPPMDAAPAPPPRLAWPAISPDLLWMGLFAAMWWGAWVYQIHGEWSLNPQYFHGWGVPFLAGYLFFKRWETRPRPGPATHPKTCLAVAVFCLLAWAPLWVVRVPNMDWRLLDWLFSLCAVGLTLAALFSVGGRAWLSHFATPVLFVLLAVPWFTRMETGFVLGLTRLIVEATTEVALMIGWPAWSAGNVIYLPTGTVGVEEACSGVRSFQGTLMASVFFGELHRLRPGGRFFLVGAGLLVALVLNFCRTLTLTLIAGNWGNAAVEEWHDFTGYLVLGASFGALWGMVWILTKFLPSIVSLRPAKTSWPGTDFRKVVRGAPAGDGGAAAPAGPAHPSRYYWVGGASFMVVVVALTASWYRPTVSAGEARPDWAVVWPKDPALEMRDIPEGIQSVLRYNQGESVVWRQESGAEWWIYYFRWMPKTPGAHLAAFHSPEVCLPSVGITLKRHVGVYRHTRGGVELAFNVYQFDRSGEPLFVFFSYWQEGMQFGTGDFLSQSGYRLGLSPRDRLDRVRRGLVLGEQRVLEAAVSGPRDAMEAITRFEAFLERAIQIPES